MSPQFLRTLSTLALALSMIATNFAMAQAQTSGAYTLEVRVSGDQGAAVSNAAVTVSGPVKKSGKTDASGAFKASGLPAGDYLVSVTADGYVGATRDVTLNSNAVSSFGLLQISQTSLTQIGRVEAKPVDQRLNLSTSAQNIVTSDTFRDQGETQITHVLNEVPGVQVVASSNLGNANPAQPVFVSVRGSFAYETATFIDGHRIASGTTGVWSPRYLAPALLQDVEVVRGPGAEVPQVINAINGSVNFKTREPSRQFSGIVSYGTDGYGGDFFNAAFSGTTLNGKLGYAGGYAVLGNPGIGNFDPQLFLPNGWELNGKVVSGVNIAPTPVAGINNSQNPAATTLLTCCVYDDSFLTNRAELGKLRWNFSPVTSLTASFMSSQATNALYGGNAAGEFVKFTPSASYTGSLQPGTYYINATSAPARPTVSGESDPVYQADFRTRIAGFDFLARYYVVSDILTSTAGIGATATSFPILPVTVYGNQGTTVYNGVPGQIQTSFIQSGASFDRLHGGSMELSRTIGNHFLTLSFDRNKVVSSSDPGSTILYGGTPFVFNACSVCPGSYNGTTTAFLRDVISAGDQAQVSIADYLTVSSLHYGLDTLGVNLATSNFYNHSPRLGLNYRPDRDTILRFSIGASVAPLYLNDYIPSTSTPVIQVGNTFATQTQQNLGLRPETGFGFNLGFDRRFGDGLTIASMDVYRTNVQNQVFSSYIINGTFTGFLNNNPTSGQMITVPLLVSENRNLGHARYEGIEFGLHRSPPVGFGFTLQGAMLRAYPYLVPDGFYSNTSNPAVLATNLGTVAGANFAYSGLPGIPGTSAGSVALNVPYATGYGAISFRSQRGGLLSLGATYQGSNNSIHVPAYFLGNATAAFPIWDHGTMLEFSIYNLTNYLPGKYATEFGGIPIPLVNGSVNLTTQGVLGPRVMRIFMSQKLGK